MHTKPQFMVGRQRMCVPNIETSLSLSFILFASHLSSQRAQRALRDLPVASEGNHHVFALDCYFFHSLPPLNSHTQSLVGRRTQGEQIRSLECVRSGKRANFSYGAANIEFSMLPKARSCPTTADNSNKDKRLLPADASAAAASLPFLSPSLFPLQSSGAAAYLGRLPSAHFRAAQRGVKSKSCSSAREREECMVNRLSGGKSGLRRAER